MIDKREIPVYPKLTIIRILQPPSFKEEPNTIIKMFEQFAKDNNMPIVKKFMIKKENLNQK